MNIFNTSYSALNVNSVVNVPGPAINGKAIGTIEAAAGASCLKKSVPRTISSPMMNSTTAPATANELMSTLKRSSNPCPKNIKAISNTNATLTHFNGLTSTPLALIATTTGNDPNISITTNRIMLAESISNNEPCNDSIFQFCEIKLLVDVYCYFINTAKLHVLLEIQQIISLNIDYFLLMLSIHRQYPDLFYTYSYFTKLYLYSRQ